MKSKITLSLISALLASPAFAMPQPYGKIDLSVDYMPRDNHLNKDDHHVQFNSNNTLFGIKGEEKLNQRFSVMYQSEWTFILKRNGNETFTPRNQLIGIQDKQLGTLKYGKNDTPLKQLGVIVDSYNHAVENNADMQGIMGGENRIDNTLTYESPAFKVADAKINATLMLPIGPSDHIEKSKGGAKVAGKDIGRTFSGSIIYKAPVVTAGLAYDYAIPTNFLRKGYITAIDTETSTSGAFAAANTIRAIAKVDLDNGLSLRGLYQNAEVNQEKGNSANAVNIDQANSWLVGVEYQLPQAKKWTLKAQYTQTNTNMKNGQEDRDIWQVMGGADYAFSKNLRAYGYAGYLTLEQGAKEDNQLLIGQAVEWKF
ncbi:porin [Acinetobacter lanii]|uniref:Porin n=1 Tax=Acinetobacter lanii TaxID=2715163 RepID=A0A6G8S1T1_9GAMM|nr:porin [Acinetobacter lanii]QIO08074.1 porin [Acinetobacter lanii]